MRQRGDDANRGEDHLTARHDTEDNRAILLYDADCGVCKFLVARVLAWDRRRNLRPASLQSAEADALLGPMDTETKMSSWHLVTADGSVHSAGAAFPPLLRRLPAGAPLAVLTARLPRLTERGYRLVASNRNHLGRRIPSGWKRSATESIAARSRPE